MCVLYKSCCILILQKGVPWIKEMMVLKDFPLLPAVAVCSTALYSTSTGPQTLLLTKVITMAFL